LAVLGPGQSCLEADRVQVVAEMDGKTAQASSQARLLGLSPRAEVVRRVPRAVYLVQTATRLRVVHPVLRSVREAHDPVCLSEQAKRAPLLRRESLDSLRLLVTVLLRARKC